MKPSHRTTRRSFLHRALQIGVSGAIAPVALARRAATSAAAEPSESDGWQVGCFTRPWDQYDYRTALDAIAEAGFQHAGLMTTKNERGNLVISVHTTPEEASRIGLEARQRGLEIPSVYGGGFPVEKSLEAGIQGLRTLIDNCAAAKAKTLMLGGTGDPRLVNRYYKAVAEVCDYAAERRVGMVLKPHGGLNATGPQCRKTIEGIGHKSFTLWYDPGNIFYYSDGKLDPVDDAPSAAGLVTGMCVKDFSMSVTDGKISKDVLLNPGTGRVDFPGVLAALKKGGFTGGPLVIETLARGEPDAILAAAKQARQFVERLVA
ncbi:MAG: sugar phosphate isomerase/epimerase [Pirellulales bacterium]|nr:sugar phosphate isomerase/epimerase [Pirellulales bacterium]